MKLKVMLSTLFIVSNTAFSLSPSYIFLENFFGYCVYSAPNFKTLIALAEVSKWKNLSEQESQIFGPIDKTDEFKGWHVSNRDGDYILGYTKKHIDNKIVYTCSIYSPTWDVSEVKPFLKKNEIAQELIFHNKVGMQNYDAWNGKVNGFTSMLIMTTYDGLSGGTLGLAVKANS